MPRQVEYIYTEPRDLQGSPYQVAEVTAQQAVKTLDVASKALEDTFVMARLAEMQRQQDARKRPNGADFPGSPLGRRLSGLLRDVVQAREILTKLTAGIGYDPSVEL